MTSWPRRVQETLSPMKLGASEDVSFTSSSAQSGALNGTAIRVVSSGADCRIRAGSAPTATDTLLKDGVPEYFEWVSGEKLAAIRDASTDGTLNITVEG